MFHGKLGYGNFSKSLCWFYITWPCIWNGRLQLQNNIRKLSLKLRLSNTGSLFSTLIMWLEMAGDLWWADTVPSQQFFTLTLIFSDFCALIDLIFSCLHLLTVFALGRHTLVSKSTAEEMATNVIHGSQVEVDGCYEILAIYLGSPSFM